jgi:antitoxin (DNA-binding transcriptional repressor) of toxin-antitoxin stability system
MDEVAQNGGEIIITKNGKPVAKLTALQERPNSLFGAGRGRMTILGDIISPLDIEWEAQSDPDRVLNP